MDCLRSPGLWSTVAPLALPNSKFADCDLSIGTLQATAFAILRCMCLIIIYKRRSARISHPSVCCSGNRSPRLASRGSTRGVPTTRGRAGPPGRPARRPARHASGSSPISRRDFSKFFQLVLKLSGSDVTHSRSELLLLLLEQLAPFSGTALRRERWNILCGFSRTVPVPLSARCSCEMPLRMLPSSTPRRTTSAHGHIPVCARSRSPSAPWRFPLQPDIQAAHVRRAQLRPAVLRSA